MVKQLNEHFEDQVFQRLEDVKGDRTWKQAIKEEFGIEGKQE